MGSTEQRIQQALHEGDELQLMMDALVARSKEWTALWRQMLRAVAVEDSRDRGHEQPAVLLAQDDDDASILTQEDVDRLLQRREELLADLIMASNRFLSLAPPRGEFARREPT